MASDRKSGAAALSVVPSTTLVGLKLMAGLFSGSVSTISEAIHSANDLLSARIAYCIVRIADPQP